MSKNRISTVRSIGAAERKTGEVAGEIVASVPDTWDWTARGAVPQAILAWVTEGDVDSAPAQKKGPKGAQTVTDFGRGVDKLRKAVAELVREDKPKPVRLAVTMSGDDAPVTGTMAVDPEAHPELYASLVEFLAAAQAETE